MMTNEPLPEGFSIGNTDNSKRGRDCTPGGRPAPPGSTTSSARRRDEERRRESKDRTSDEK
jgi:hypothetical protein